MRQRLQRLRSTLQSLRMKLVCLQMEKYSVRYFERHILSLFCCVRNDLFFFLPVYDFLLLYISLSELYNFETEQANEAVEKAKCVKAAHVASQIANHAYLAARKSEIDAYHLLGYVNKANEAIYEAQQAASYAAEDAERFKGRIRA